MFAKIKPFRSARYRAWVRSKPCCYSGSEYGVEAHHIIDVGMGGIMGGKPSDLFAIPLTSENHAQLHSKDGLNIDQKAEALKMIAMAVNEGVLVLK